MWLPFASSGFETVVIFPRPLAKHKRNLIDMVIDPSLLDVAVGLESSIVHAWLGQAEPLSGAIARPVS
jgi:hypothetical protein